MVYQQNFLDITSDIRLHPEFLKTKKFTHHGIDNSVYSHSIATAYFAYRIATKLHMSDSDVLSITRAALLHDFTGYDWREQHSLSEHTRNIFKRLWRMHAFQHGFRASDNATQYFELSDKQKDAIRKHMFPLVPFFPRYKEGWIVTYSDKIIASKEMSIAVWHSIKRNYNKLRHVSV